MNITEVSQRFYDEHGFMVLPNFASPAQITALQERALALIDAWEMSPEERSIFTTTANRHVDDPYFLSSGDQIRFFFEENVFDASGSLRCTKHNAINKIGHALHALDPVFAAFSTSTDVAALAQMLGYMHPAVVQSMVIFKQPGIGGAVAPHQDSTFLYTDPQSCCGLWIALQDATISNGCLWVQPGSHRSVPVRQRFVRRSERDTDGVQFVPLHAPHADERSSEATQTAQHAVIDAATANTEFIPLEVPAGTCVVLHGGTVHKSEANHSSASRHAYTLHFIEQHNTTYPKDNWLQPTHRNTFIPLQPSFYPQR